MSANVTSFAGLRALVGREIGVSRWIEVDQTMIDRFAGTTGDHQWIHVDVDRARRESPFGTTVAHGFLTLSLIAGMNEDFGITPHDVRLSVNYGLDRVRFLTPVRAGARVRLRSSLLSLQEKSPGRFLMRSECTVEIEGEARPALVAETLVLLILEGASVDPEGDVPLPDRSGAS